MDSPDSYKAVLIRKGEMIRAACKENFWHLQV